MTVCIAAECYEGTRHRILCADGRLENTFTGADVGFKALPIGDNWWAMTAGGASAAREALFEYVKHFADHEKMLDHANVTEHVRTVIQKYKAIVIEEYVRTRYQITYTDLLQNGRAWLPEDVYAEAWLDIRRWQLDCWLIIAGFIKAHRPYIFLVNDAACVEQHEPFAVIGSDPVTSWHSQRCINVDIRNSSSLPRPCTACTKPRKSARALPVLDSRLIW